MLIHANFYKSVIAFKEITCPESMLDLDTVIVFNHNSIR